MLWAIVLAGMAGCASDPEPRQQAQERHAVSTDSQGALQHFEAQDPSLQALIDSSVGYATFPDVGKGGLVVGGAYGRGQVFDNKGVLIGYASISQATVGAQIGAQTYSELLVFNTQEALDDFKQSRFSFSANASAVAIKAGAAGSAKPSNGVTVFIEPKGGLMAEAAIGGQKFRFEPL